MYPVTDEVMALFENEQRKVLRITGTDRNGATISITDDNVIEDSFQIDRYSCNGEKLEIGTAIAGQLTLKLENGNGQYDGIMFEGAELFVEVGIADWTQSSPTVTYIPCGYFTPDEQPRRLSTISITALDRMMRFDAVSLTKIPWTTRSGEVITTDSGEPIYFVKSIRFPCTIAQIVAQAAALCNVPFTQDLSGFPNANISIQELPVPNKDITYRTLIQWCAAIMGCNAWIDWTGSLRFSWYENTTDYVSTIDNRYSSDLYENDLSITGVAYTNNSGIQFVEGSADYTVDIVGNLLIGAQVVTMLPAINVALNGFTYRPFMAAAVNAPYLWPMDVITFRDKEGNDHTSALTNVAFRLNGTTAMESKGMTYATNRGVQPSGFTKEQAQLVNEVKQSIVDLDDSLTQEEIFNRLTDNGAAQGVILYNGQLYVNASYIRTGTLIADLVKAGVLGDVAGKNYWNMETGEFSLSATATVGGSTVEDIAQSEAEQAVEDFDETLTQQDVFNRLTDNGVAQGIILNNGQLYINASYIQTGTLTLGGLNNQNGTLRVLNAAGQEIGTWTKDGISIQRGDINLDSSGSIKVGFNAADTKYVLFNNQGMNLMLENGSKVYTGTIRFGNSDYYPVSTDLGTLVAQYTEGTEVFDTTIGPGYLNIFHSTNNVGDHELEYDIESFRVSGPSGAFQVNSDDGEVNTSYEFKLGTPLGIPYGGTGATTPALHITTQYVSIAEAINTVCESRVFPISLQKSGARYYGDMPTGYEQAEWNMELVGDSTRLTAFLFLYGQTGVYKRDFYNGSWYTGWQLITPITKAASAVSIPSVGNTATVNITGLTSDHQLVRWNFSSSPENAPPADLAWETFDGYFTITNNGGTTSESITPVFILPQ